MNTHYVVLAGGKSIWSMVLPFLWRMINLTVESDAPYLGKEPTSTHVLIEQLAALRQVSVEHLKLAMLSNMLRFLQPSLVASDNWPAVFEFAKSFARKPTDMTVVSRHVRHFTTTTRPQLKWSETDLENY